MKVKGSNKLMVVRFEIEPPMMQTYVLWTAMALAGYREKYCENIDLPDQELIKLQEIMLRKIFLSSFTRMHRYWLAASLEEGGESVLTDFMCEKESKEYRLVRPEIKKRIFAAVTSTGNVKNG